MKQNYVINVNSRSLKTIPSEFFSPFKTNSILFTQRESSGEILEVKCTFWTDAAQMLARDHFC